MKVLIVDDNGSFVQAMKMVIETWGAVVDGARSADDALALLKRHAYDFILLDLQMPGHDGLWLMRHADLPPETRVILVSGFIPAQIVRNLQQWGISRALIKPFSNDDLFACFGFLLRQPLVAGQA